MLSNLPPGCTDKDIEIAAGAVECRQCGRIIWDPEDDERLCPRCSRDPDRLREDREED